MNTIEAYEKVKQGYRVGVVITDIVTGDQHVYEVDDEVWQSRVERVPNNTNYTMLSQPKILSPLDGGINDVH